MPDQKNQVINGIVVTRRVKRGPNKPKPSSDGGKDAR